MKDKEEKLVNKLKKHNLTAPWKKYSSKPRDM